MTRKWLVCKDDAEVTLYNQTVHGYPSAGVPLAGGVVGPGPGTVGWTDQDAEPLAIKGAEKKKAIYVDESKIPEAKKKDLEATLSAELEVSAMIAEAPEDI